MKKELLNYTGVWLWVSGNQVYLLKPFKGSCFAAFICTEDHELIVDTLSICGYSKEQVKRICLQVFEENPRFGDYGVHGKSVRVR